MGIITEVRESGRSAYIKCASSNRVYLRNCIFLRRDTIEDEEDEEEDMDVDSEEESADMAIAVCHGTASQVSNEAGMEQAWERGERREQASQATAASEVQPAFSLPACQPVKEEHGVEKVSCVYRRYSGIKYCTSVENN